MKLAILLLTLTGIMNAETVFLTAHGKTFHTARNCMALARAATVLEADDKTATAHGLHVCGICAKRGKGGGAGKKADNSSFAKETAAAAVAK